MTEDSQEKNYPRRAWVAFVLSLLFPGVGQIYCGKIRRGLVFGLLFLFLMPIYTLVFAHTFPIPTPWLMASGALFLGICLIPCVDAARLAHRVRPDYRCKDYNRATIYILVTLIGGGAALGFDFYIRAYYFEAFRVPAASMYPTIIPNDRLIGNKTVYRRRDPLRGELAIFIPVVNRHQRYIKRVVALAGDTVEVRDGQLIVNDQLVPRTELPDWTLASIPAEIPDGLNKGRLIQGTVYEEDNGRVCYRVIEANDQSRDKGDFAKTTVPEHHCFVLGDNRAHSFDSRAFGPVPLATLIARADMLYCPSKDWSRFGPLTP
jgi:signal peptidase I